MNYESLVKIYNSIHKNKIPYQKPSFSESKNLEPLVRTIESNIDEILIEYFKIKKVQEIKKRFGIKQEKVSIEATKKVDEKIKEVLEKKEIEKVEKERMYDKEIEKIEKPELEVETPKPKGPEKLYMPLTINYNLNIIFPFDTSEPKKKADEHVKEIYSKSKMKFDENEIKKKMFEYTKQLFKTKDTSERERIKSEIVALKNMLGGGTTEANLLALLISHQNFEINNMLNLIEKEFERNFDDLILQTKDTISRALSDSDVLAIKREFQNKFISLILEISKVAEVASDYFTVHHFSETRLAKERYAINGALDSQETAIMRYKIFFGDFVSSLKEKGDERSRVLF